MFWNINLAAAEPLLRRMGGVLRSPIARRRRAPNVPAACGEAQRVVRGTAGAALLAPPTRAAPPGDLTVSHADAPRGP
jgi:hypothetical protein